MKKLLPLISILTMLSSAIGAYAASGDIAGKIYSTDIKATINGVGVDSYNIGGRTVIVLENTSGGCNYYDEFRTLICNSFAPYDLMEGKKEVETVSGKVVGNIYETNIKTYIRGKEMPCYSLDGRMAVAIEDLGNDNEYSDIGGKYIWNGESRTIDLEMVYDNTSEILDVLKEKNLNAIVDYSTGVVEFERAPIISGGFSASGESNGDNLTHDGEMICQMFDFKNLYFYDESGTHSLKQNTDRIYYWDVNKIKEITSEMQKAEPTYEDWLYYYQYNTLSDVLDEYETDEYKFMYISHGNTHGATQALVKLNKNDGTRICYDNNFESVSLHGQKYFEDVVIDKENEKVYLHYDVDYVIDLKTDKIEQIN